MDCAGAVDVGESVGVESTDAVGFGWAEDEAIGVWDGKIEDGNGVCKGDAEGEGDGVGVGIGVEVGNGEMVVVGEGNADGGEEGRGVGEGATSTLKSMMVIDGFPISIALLPHPTLFAPCSSNARTLTV